MVLKSVVLALCVVPLMHLPVEAAAFSAVWTGTAPQLMTVAHHGGDDFGRRDAWQLAKSMGYHVVDINEVHHGFVVTGFNHDGKWRIFIDHHGSVGSVTHIGGGHHHGGDDDQDNNNDDDDNGDD